MKHIRTYVYTTDNHKCTLSVHLTSQGNYELQAELKEYRKILPNVKVDEWYDTGIYKSQLEGKLKRHMEALLAQARKREENEEFVEYCNMIRNHKGDEVEIRG